MSNEGYWDGGIVVRVVVVGAGFAGLMAAWRMRQAGHEVVVLEARGPRGGGGGGVARGGAGGPPRHARRAPAGG
ncbi:MAG: FAD-dependent oxidoreductase, partial [Actinomycetia bacterium]|nr:FAD-dependent oxidoreductase [Actinomycetes bacterium]